MEKELMEQKISSEMIYQGRILNVRLDQVLLPNGNKSAREVVELSGAVTIVPVNQAGEVYLVRQYRYPVAELLLELPAGKMEPGESPETCARRELIEETGFTAEKCDYICEFYTTPGCVTEKMYLFLARSLVSGQQNLDEDEFLEVTSVSLDEAVEMIYNGTIKDGKTITGLLAVQRFLTQISGR